MELGFADFEKAQAFTNDFTRRAVASVFDEFADEFLQLVGQ